MGVNFFPGKMTKTRGGESEGGLAKDHTFSHFFFEPFPKSYERTMSDPFKQTFAQILFGGVNIIHFSSIFSILLPIFCCQIKYLLHEESIIQSRHATQALEQPREWQLDKAGADTHGNSSFSTVMKVDKPFIQQELSFHTAGVLSNSWSHWTETLSSSTDLTCDMCLEKYEDSPWTNLNLLPGQLTDALVMARWILVRTHLIIN